MTGHTFVRVFMLGASEAQIASLQAAGKKMIPLEQLGQEPIQPPDQEMH